MNQYLNVSSLLTGLAMAILLMGAKGLHTLWVVIQNQQVEKDARLAQDKLIAETQEIVKQAVAELNERRGFDKGYEKARQEQKDPHHG